MGNVNKTYIWYAIDQKEDCLNGLLLWGTLFSITEDNNYQHGIIFLHWKGKKKEYLSFDRFGKEIWMLLLCKFCDVTDYCCTHRVFECLGWTSSTREHTDVWRGLGTAYHPDII